VPARQAAIFFIGDNLDTGPFWDRAATRLRSTPNPATIPRATVNTPDPTLPSPRPREASSDAAPAPVKPRVAATELHI
jgi:hypothetical protein